MLNSECYFLQTNEISPLRLMRYNAPEWPYIVGGCLAALMSGACSPAYAMVLAEVLGVGAIIIN